MSFTKICQEALADLKDFRDEVENLYLDDLGKFYTLEKLVDLLSTRVLSEGTFWEICRERFIEEHDYLVALVRAFRDGSADFIAINSRRQQYQIKATDLASSLNFLFFEEREFYNDQYTEWRFRLTDLGRRIILSSSAPNQYAIPI